MLFNTSIRLGLMGIPYNLSDVRGNHNHGLNIGRSAGIVRRFIMEEKVDALIEQALKNGGLDNVTAVLMAVR
jgi:hypothetical protein